MIEKSLHKVLKPHIPKEKERKLAVDDVLHYLVQHFYWGAKLHKWRKFAKMKPKYGSDGNLFEK